MLASGRTPVKNSPYLNRKMVIFNPKFGIVYVPCYKLESSCVRLIPDNPKLGLGKVEAVIVEGFVILEANWC